jgi:predicted transposase YdaD
MESGLGCLPSPIDERDFRLSDIDAKRVIQKISKCENATEFQALEKKQRDKYIKRLKEKGLSIRQISRLTGISFAIVRKL